MIQPEKKLQIKFCRKFEYILADKMKPGKLVLIPSLTMDEDILSKISGEPGNIRFTAIIRGKKFGE